MSRVSRSNTRLEREEPDPWRYECPDCGHRPKRWRRITEPRNQRGTFTAGGVGTAEMKERMELKYNCKKCGTSHKRLWDKKDKRMATP